MKFFRTLPLPRAFVDLQRGKDVRFQAMHVTLDGNDDIESLTSFATGDMAGARSHLAVLALPAKFNGVARRYSPIRRVSGRRLTICCKRFPECFSKTSVIRTRLA
jgi:hypothetical protein